jgi:hypothetical protein
MSTSFHIHIKDRVVIQLQVKWLVQSLAIQGLELPDLQGLEEKAFLEQARLLV